LCGTLRWRARPAGEQACRRDVASQARPEGDLGGQRRPGGDSAYPKTGANEILDVRGENDDKLRFILDRDGISGGARRHQPDMQPRIDRGEMHEESGVEPHQPVAAVQGPRKRGRVSDVSSVIG
jgi:hypothetical protein